MNRIWIKIMIPLLFLMMLATPLRTLAETGVTATIPFTVEYAPGTVVMEAVDDAPEPEQSSFDGVVQGSFAIAFTKPGNYAYRLYQKAGADSNVAYDQTVFNVEIAVMNDAPGEMYAVVTVSVQDHAHKPESVAFENVRKTGGLSVSKTVAGDKGDPEREWHFTITLSEKRSALYDGVWFDLGVGRHVTVRHGETVTVRGLPAGVSYEITEDEANTDGYTTTATGDRGVIGDGTVSAAAFVNEKSSASTPSNDPSAPGTSNPSDPSTPSPSNPSDPSAPGTSNPSNPSAPGTNNPSGPSSSASQPKTGDESNLILWIGLGAFSLVAIIIILLMEHRRRSANRRKS